MKSKEEIAQGQVKGVNFWVTLAATSLGAVAIVWGAAVSWSKHNDKVNSAVSQTELTTVIRDVKDSIHLVIGIQKDMVLQLSALDGKLIFVGEQFKAHIKKEKDLSDTTKLNDIIRLVEGLSEDLKKRDNTN
jgi:hypothetical protein